MLLGLSVVDCFALFFEDVVYFSLMCCFAWRLFDRRLFVCFMSFVFVSFLGDSLCMSFLPRRCNHLCVSVCAKIIILRDAPVRS